MRKIVKKGMALASATIMIAGSMPMTAVNISASENDGNQIAVQSEQGTEIQTEQDITVQADGETASGIWGTCAWTYDNGTLTIGGGVCPGGGYSSRPWNEYVDSIKKIVITDKITFSSNTMSEFFTDMRVLESIDGLANLDTSNIVYMGSMFKGCKSLTSLDLSGFNTSNVETMEKMFEDCQKIESLDVSKFATGKVTDMKNMFRNCKALTSLDLSGFDTAKVTDMEWMFGGCNSLTSLDLSGFDTSKVTNMEYMFSSCNMLISLDLSAFNTSNVNSMNGMFQGCQNIESIDVSKFATGKVTGMSHMFYGCKSLISLDVSGFDTDNVTDMYCMFWQCEKIESLDLSEFNTGKVTDMASMFYGCNSLSSLDISGFNTSGVKRMNCMFENCQKIESIDVSAFQTGNVTTMERMFSGCNSLTSLDLSGFDTSNVERINSMFADCSRLQSLDLSKFNTEKITSTNKMFSGCSSLTTLDISNFNTGNVTDMTYMFYGCKSLTSLDLSNFNTAKVTNMGQMFFNCSNLKELNVSSFDTSKVTRMSSMFSGCGNLHELDMSSFDTSNVNDYIFGFYSNTITKIKLPNKMSSKFADGIKSTMLLGRWKDETSNAIYDDKDSLVLEEGHTYVFCPEEMKVSLVVDNNYNNNKKVKVSATAEGGASRYTYQFIMHNPADNSWTVLQDYSDSNIYVWDIVQNKNKELYVNVKDALGNVVRSTALTIEPDTIADVIKNNNLEYTVKKDSSGIQLLIGVKPAIKADSFKKSFGANITIKSVDGTELAANAVVGTGCIVELIRYNKVVDTATVVVKGDTDGNGSIDVLDMEAIQKSILGIGDKLSGTYKEAALLTDGDDITVLDMEAIQKDILGIQKIN